MTLRRGVLINLLIILLTCSLFVVGCAFHRKINWHYVLPDDYQGYLAIWYDCPGGVPIPLQDNSARITFNDKGIFCTSDSHDHVAPSWSSSITAETRSGQSVRFVIGFKDESGKQLQGYALSGGHTRVIGGGTQENPGEDVVIDLFWAGKMQDSVNIGKAPGIKYHLDVFLAENFGMRPQKTDQ